MSNVILRPRRGTASQWTSANPVLAEGEIGIEVPSSGVGKGLVKMKFGDGSTAWKNLPYAVTNVSVVQNLDTASITNVPSVSAVKSAIDELGESVAEGKALIASAITDKGVETDSNATFETMASNIENLNSGGNCVFVAGAEDFTGSTSDYKPVIYSYNSDIVSYDEDTNIFTFKKNVTVSTRTIVNGTGGPGAYYQLNNGDFVQCSSTSVFRIVTLTLSVGDTLKIVYRNNSGHPYIVRGNVTCCVES